MCWGRVTYVNKRERDRATETLRNTETETERQNQRDKRQRGEDLETIGDTERHGDKMTEKRR